MSTTLTLPERRVASSDTKETRRLIQRGKVQTVRHIRNAQVLVETLLSRIQKDNRKPVVNGRPVLIPKHLVPGHMCFYSKPVGKSMVYASIRED